MEQIDVGRVKTDTILELKTDFYFFIFFFQAEDGIRDADVTGVQTCALPILSRLIKIFQSMAVKSGNKEGIEIYTGSYIDPIIHSSGHISFRTYFNVFFFRLI